MKYESFVKRIARKYRAVTENGTTYFLKCNGTVVAYENSQRNLLVMYVQPFENFSHHGVSAIAIAKNFVLCNEYKTQRADVIIHNSLNGAFNSIKRISNRILDVTHCHCLTFPDYPDTDYGRRIISTMGYIHSRSQVKLDIGIKLDLSKLLIRYCNTLPSFDFDSLEYGILCYKHDGRKKVPHHISEKDYDVFNYLRKENSWYWNQGFNTCNSDVNRKRINMTEDGTNYHKAVKIDCRIV